MKEKQKEAQCAENGQQEEQKQPEAAQTAEDSAVQEEQKEKEQAGDTPEQEEDKYALLQDRYQRTLAEFDNFRKRTMKEKAGMYDDGVRDTIEKLLPVVDNLERAIMTKEDGKGEESLLKGIKMVYKQLQETLVAMGVTPIPALGEKFDPNLHAAVAHEESDEHGENEITIEMLKGYRYKEKVIRHSMVKVAN